MANSPISDRDRRLLALRSALPVGVVGITVLVVMLRMLPSSTASQVGPMLVVSILTSILFLTVHAFRLAMPNKKIWLDPGQRIVRPAFALRAGFGASLAVYSFSFVMAASFYFDPFHRRGTPDFFQFLIGGATAGATLGLLLYLLSGILFLPVRNDEPCKPKDNPIRFCFSPALYMLPALGDFTKHPFPVAIGMGCWSYGSMVGAFLFGWFAYSQIAPDAPNAFAFRRKTAVATLTAGETGI